MEVVVDFYNTFTIGRCKSVLVALEKKNVSLIGVTNKSPAETSGSSKLCPNQLWKRGAR